MELTRSEKPVLETGTDKDPGPIVLFLGLVRMC